jgi:hypothetical protein
VPKAKSKTKAVISRRRNTLFGPPLLLLGEDAAAYDSLFAGIHAAVEPVDTLDEMLVADVVALEWQVLRWRRHQSALLRACQREALEKFLRERLDYDLYYDLYVDDFADEFAKILRDNLPRDQADSAEQLAQAFSRNDRDAENKVDEILELYTLRNAYDMPLKVSDIVKRGRDRKAEQLAQEYVRREPEAVKLVDEILADASVDINDLAADQLDSRIDDIERTDRLATVAENRRNASLREIDRRRAALGETLRRSFKEIEDTEFQVIETTPTKGKTAA